MSTTTQRTTVDHPYQAAGVVLMIIALVFIAFDLGVLARCGAGEGVCFDTTNHAVSDGALVGFFVLFFIGLMLVMYSSSGSSVTRQDSPPQQVNVVSAPASPPPTTINVNTPAPAASPSLVTVNAPR